MRLANLAIGLLLAIAALPAQADRVPPSDYCSKPYKPYQFNSDFEIQNFKMEVERYKSCIDDFVEEQDRAIRNHQRAAQDSIEEWNRFVRYELQ